MGLSLVHWPGGKGRQLDHLLPLIPYTRIYVEVFGGGGAVLLNRQLSEIEVYNDLDRAIVELFEVLRDPDDYARFRRKVALMPYSRAEFERSLGHREHDNRVDRSVYFYTMLNQAVSGKRLCTTGDWSRNRTINNADAWFARQSTLNAVVDRIKNVQLECRDGLDILKQWDTVDTTFYCDPPYVLEARNNNAYYAVEPGDDWHYDLVGVLAEVRGAVVLSGYDHPVYKRLVECGWRTDTFNQDTTMDLAESKRGRSRSRVEIVFRNPQACDYAYQRPLPL